MSSEHHCTHLSCPDGLTSGARPPPGCAIALNCSSSSASAASSSSFCFARSALAALLLAMISSIICVHARWFQQVVVTVITHVVAGGGSVTGRVCVFVCLCGWVGGWGMRVCLRVCARKRHCSPQRALLLGGAAVKQACYTAPPLRRFQAVNRGATSSSQLRTCFLVLRTAAGASPSSVAPPLPPSWSLPPSSLPPPPK